MMLSDHFTLEEAIRSATSYRLGIDNAPIPEIVERMKVQAEGMELVRHLLGDYPIHIDSWYRCVALERILCAKDFDAWRIRRGMMPSNDTWQIYLSRKAHPKGLATDFLCPAYGEPFDIVKRIQDSPILFDQLIQEGRWVHIAFAPEQRREILTAVFNNGQVTYIRST